MRRNGKEREDRVEEERRSEGEGREKGKRRERFAPVAPVGPAGRQISVRSPALVKDWTV